MDSEVIPRCTCPMCGYAMDRILGLRDGRDIMDKPENAATLCISCASILFFNGDMSVRDPRPGELERFAAEDPESYLLLVRAQKLCRKMDRTRINSG